MTMKQKLVESLAQMRRLEKEQTVGDWDIRRPMKLVEEVIAEMEDQQAALYPRNWKAPKEQP